MLRLQAGGNPYGKTDSSAADTGLRWITKAWCTEKLAEQEPQWLVVATMRRR